MSYDRDYPSAQPAETFVFWYIYYAKRDRRGTIMIDRPEVYSSMRLGEHRHEH